MAPASSRQVSVIVVEADDRLRARLEQWLAPEAGFRCIGAFRDAETALATMVRVSPEIVVLDMLLTGTPRGDVYGGKFTVVHFWRSTDGLLLGTLDPCYNIFRIQNCFAYTLAEGFYGGSGNGCNGEVTSLEVNQPGDIFVAGKFTQAGGFPYSQYLGCFRASGGWQSSVVFSAGQPVNMVAALKWDNTNNRLYIDDINVNTVYGPLYPGDTRANNLSHPLYKWIGFTTSFANGYWSQ